ncbi:hypothetical protein [Phocaeicola plebeius]|jgi:hypothetical protein|uniref:hypothetical protein n=1 Tax=Phocaeicola plebeius TaxID=310297 RepID=UPI0026F0E01E|nr:hypothetical protein [Phocaeicola plebeius]MDY5977703.1 hypothetical protein [Phocaeicola plebeius]
MRYLYFLFLLLVFASCSNEQYGEHSDVNYPIPTVISITEDVAVGEQITIKGTNFIAPNSVSLDGISLKIVSESETEIVAILPRIFNTASLVVKNALGRANEEELLIKPIYPASEEICVSEWPNEITKGRPLIIRGTNMDLVTSVALGSTTIEVDGLTQQQERLLVLVPDDLSETSSDIVLRTIVGSTIQSSGSFEIKDYDPNNWEPISPNVILDFEDGDLHYVSGDMPNSLCEAKLNGGEIDKIEANKDNYFSLYAKDIMGTYSMWSYLGSIKYVLDRPVDLAEFHDPYISFLWNSDDNIGSFQLSVTQGTKVGGGTFNPGITDRTYDENAKYDLYTLRPTNKQWHCVTARLKDLVVENWGGDFKGIDILGQINAIEFVFKQINGAYWIQGAYGTENPEDIYDYSVQGNHLFKANIDNIMITDGPYTLNGYPEN